MRPFCLSLPLAAACFVSTLPGSARADEGMWLFEQFPVEKVQASYGFKPDALWLERLQRASLYVNASGAFVSPRGLILTNHHVARGCIAQLSSPDRNLEQDGFYAPVLAKEQRCPGLEVTALQTVQDVTAEIRAAEDKTLDEAANNARRKEAILRLEKGCQTSSDIRCQVVTLYGGGAWHLYRSQVWSDLRLVFAPEASTATFGGDIDNFEYPRYDLDVTFLRAYVNDQPAETSFYLPIQPLPVQEGDLVFASGHPGATQRGFSMQELEYMRDYLYRDLLVDVLEMERRLEAYAKTSPEAARQAETNRFYLANGRKFLTAVLVGLNDPARMKPKQLAEKEFRKAIAKHPQGKEWTPAFAEAKQAVKNARRLATPYRVLAGGIVGWNSSQMAQWAQRLVRFASEIQKPNEKRLPELGDAALPAFKQGLLAEVPVYQEMEVIQLAYGLEQLISGLGASHAAVKAVLAGRTPAETARQAVFGSKLDDPEVRRALLEGGVAAIENSQDPMLVLARALDPSAREVRKRFEDDVEALLAQANLRLTAARFALYGTQQYPDATNTLRLTFGQVKGFRDGTAAIPFQTDFSGLYDRAKEKGEQPPFALAPRWKSVPKLRLETQFNFVATLDITGGNSGSPVVNREGKLVGVVFDGNRPAMANDLIYNEDQARAVMVSSAGLLEALRTVYQTYPLLDELLGRPAQTP